MRKTIVITHLIALCFTVPSVVFAETVLIDPSEIKSPEVGQTFTLKIRVEGAKGLFGFEFDLKYNPELLKFVGATEGDFLQKAGQTFAVSPIVFGEKPKDGGTGTIRMGVSRLGGSGVDGNGVLAHVEFEVQKTVSRPLLLEFKQVSLFDAQANKKAPEKMVGSKITPGRNLTPWDVNKDGVVNVLDLVIVASQFGHSGDSLTGDANGDGVVNVLDLVTVASHFGERAVAATPSLHVERNMSLPVPNVEPIRRALVELEKITHPSRGAEIARQMLRAWLADIAPIVTETKLLPNYPNPFNPETWIPFELAAVADVTIEIYDAKGQQIRTLALGQRPAGSYLTRERAAYWDGRNGRGEPVASGVYFYTFTAGTFTETRKLMVLK